MRFLIALAPALACSCALDVDADTPLDGDGDATGANAVVGGSAEARFPAVGFLASGPSRDALAGPICGATLIAPDVAVTASHCIHGAASTTSFALGLGGVGSADIYMARKAFEHPRYDPSSTPRYRHDVAVLVLDTPVADTAPTAVAAAHAGDESLYVGYGRTTTGGQSRADGYTGERKSTAEHIDDIISGSAFVHGEGGGLCWGDSGGGLLDGDGAILGVLADFNGWFDCHDGNQMVFTELASERDFLARARRCADDADPSCISSCNYECSVWGYADGDCNEGWECSASCLSYTGCGR